MLTFLKRLDVVEGNIIEIVMVPYLIEAVVAAAAAASPKSYESSCS
jgi:hypothetical protein